MLIEWLCSSHHSCVLGCFQCSIVGELKNGNSPEKSLNVKRQELSYLIFPFFNCPYVQDYLTIYWTCIYLKICHFLEKPKFRNVSNQAGSCNRWDYPSIYLHSKYPWIILISTVVRSLFTSNYVPLPNCAILLCDVVSYVIIIIIFTIRILKSYICVNL